MHQQNNVESFKQTIYMKTEFKVYLTMTFSFALEKIIIKL